MERRLIEDHLKTLRGRMQPDGAWPLLPGRQGRPDATAWALLALQAWGEGAEFLKQGREGLKGFQREDGGVPLLALQPAALWPGALAVLAWHGVAEYEPAAARAIDRLLRVEIRFDPDSEQGHDASIRGWPWIEATHPWVEPTALSLLALSAAGKDEHSRFQQGLRLLLDRQLPEGGWNYGNTRVLGSTLRPLPGPTGLALMALAGRVEAAQLEKSLAYAEAQLPQARSPRTLGLLMMGLAAWKVDAQAPQALACLAASPVNPHMSDHLAMALLALAPGKFPGLAAAEGEP